MFDGLKFWKKKEDFSLNLDLESGEKEKEPFFKEASEPFGQASDPFSANDPFKNDPFKDNHFKDPFREDPSQTQQAQFSSQQQSGAHESSMPGTSASQKDVELISSKLDTVKALLENVIQRLDKLEREKEKEDKQSMQQKRWY